MNSKLTTLPQRTVGDIEKDKQLAEEIRAKADRLWARGQEMGENNNGHMARMLKGDALKLEAASRIMKSWTVI